VAYLFYARLIGLTAGTLIYLFLLALILGHRRPRFFERLLFFLTLSLFLVYAGGLLEINAQIQYGVVPRITHSLSAVLSGLGVLFLPALLVHVPLAYRRDLERVQTSLWWRVGLALLYAAPFIPFFVLAFLNRNDLARTPAGARFEFLPLISFVANGSTLLLLVPAVLLSAGFDLALWRQSKGQIERQFFRQLCETSLVIFVALLAQASFGPLTSRNDEATVLIVLAVAPGAILIYYALKHNFLEYGAQRNLVYALSATFLALLYLAFVRRISGWLEPVLPP
jgi:hypothetical protein